MSEEKKIDFFFQPYAELEHSKDCPVLFVVFEEQVDMIISQKFPEVEIIRQRLDNVRQKGDETVTLFALTREEKVVTAGVIYVEYPWRKKRTKRNPDFGSINFYRKLGERTTFAMKALREKHFTEATILLPGRFHPENLKDDARREELEVFVKTMVESIVYANASLDRYLSNPDPKIVKITFTYFGQYERAVTNFFNRAIISGSEVGETLAEVREATELPPNDCYPLKLAEKLLGNNLGISGAASKNWRKVTQSKFSSSVKASIIYGTEGLGKRGFGLIAAVGRGSKYEPCFLKFHYKPPKRAKPIKTVSLIGKGVTFDTGGIDLKGSDYYGRMHYDMAGAASIVGVLKLADEKKLPVEIVVLLPLVENMIGSRATRPHDIVKAYDGQSVEIINTDAEGRLILADAMAYSEKHIHPDCTVTVATLCDMSEFAPDFLKVLVNDQDLKRKAELAERKSKEKMLLFPPLEYFNEVDRAFVGERTDLKNHSDYYYHSGMIFLSSFLQWEPSPWMFLDISAIFESDAEEYGAGPGFGVRFLWQFVKQFA